METANTQPYELYYQYNAMLRLRRIRCIVQTPPPLPLAGVFPTSPPLFRQYVLGRQHERGVDNVGCCLSRTVRSCIQYNASVHFGAVGAGSQCRHGECMENAMSIFGGKGNDGIPAVLVEALCKV